MTETLFGFKGWDLDALAKVLQETFAVIPQRRDNSYWGEYFAFDWEVLRVYLVENRSLSGSADPEEAAEPNFLEYPVVLYIRSDNVTALQTRQILAIPRAQCLYIEARTR